MPARHHFDLLRKFHVSAMGDKLREIVGDQRYDPLTFEEKMELVIDAEEDARESRKVSRLVGEAALANPSACVEETGYLPERGLSKDRILRLADCGWVDEHRVVVVISASGRGKSYVAQAIGVAACRLHHHVSYARLADLFDGLNRARAQGGTAYYELMDHYKGVELLVLDDFLASPAGPENSVDLHEIIVARDSRRATVVASPIEPNEWYLQIDGPVMADAIPDRLAKGSTYIDIAGPNMREYYAKKGAGASL